MYLDANNLPQRLVINSFEWMEQLSEFDDCFIKNYDENNDKGYILDVDFEYPKKLFSIHCDLPFLPGRKKIGKMQKACW